MAFVVRRAPYLVPEFILLPAKVRVPLVLQPGQSASRPIPS